MKKALCSIIIIIYLLFIIVGYIHEDTVRLNVHYISQKDMKSCGIVSVAMAISYYENLNDNPLDVETLWEISGSDEDIVCQYGNDVEGLRNVANHYGYESEYREHMEISDIEDFLSKGILVILDIKNKKGPRYHVLLVVGYDKNKKILYINDPTDRQNKVLEYSDLESRWSAYLSSRTGSHTREFHRGGFIIYPK